jgi:hypothetical protein
MYQKREDREERGYFEVVPEVLLGAFAVVRRVGGFGGESPWRFVSFCWSENLGSGDIWDRHTASYVDASQEDGDVSRLCEIMFRRRGEGLLLDFYT